MIACHNVLKGTIVPILEVNGEYLVDTLTSLLHTLKKKYVEQQSELQSELQSHTPVASKRTITAAATMF